MGACLSSPFNLHFHWFFCFSSENKAGGENTQNKLLLRILQSLQRLLRRLWENGFLPQFCTDKNKQVFHQRREKIQNECGLAIRLRLGMQRMEAVTQNKWEISQLHTHARLCLDSLKLIFCFLYVFFSFSGKSEDSNGSEDVKTLPRSSIWVRLCGTKSAQIFRDTMAEL